jgi:hypothetical protein
MIRNCKGVFVVVNICQYEYNFLSRGNLMGSLNKLETEKDMTTGKSNPLTRERFEAAVKGCFIEEELRVDDEGRYRNQALKAAFAAWCMGWTSAPVMAAENEILMPATPAPAMLAAFTVRGASLRRAQELYRGLFEGEVRSRERRHFQDVMTQSYQPALSFERWPDGLYRDRDSNLAFLGWEVARIESGSGAYSTVTLSQAIGLEHNPFRALCGGSAGHAKEAYDAFFRIVAAQSSELRKRVK